MAWATFIRDDCEWSGPEAAASCFGHREPGFRVRAVRAAGARWYVWDPSTDNFAYVSRNALSLPAELTRDDDPTGQPAKAVVSCVDRSTSYRFMSQARDGIGKWIQDSAQPGDVFYERWIEDNSYRPEAEIVPAIRVPLQPTGVPALPPTPGQPNPFDRDRVAQATATVGAIQTVEEQTSATRTAIAQTVQNDIAHQVSTLTAESPDQSDNADVSGCFKKGAELLQGFDGDRYLLMALNLEDGPPDASDVRLDRARLRLVYVQCDDATLCDQLRQQWLQVAASTNAADIRFFDPSEGLTGIDAT
ncbi:MAG: hypothetical protein JO057_13140 [Chloroflexi bacterium]|nr:hypothetical protein [Chloroflexota bacterium]